MPFTRRELLARAAGLAGGVAASSLIGWDLSPRASAATRLPHPSASGIDHIVVVMMENRSFDHFLGWLPGANGKQAGLNYRDHAGVTHPTYHLSQFQGCGFNDPDHSWDGGRTEYDNGACDGWLRAGSNDAL